MENGGPEGRVTKDYVSSERALPCRCPGRPGPPDKSPSAAEGTTSEGGGLRARPIENKVGCQPGLGAGCSCSNVESAAMPALLWRPAGRARIPYTAEVHVLRAVPCAPCAASACAI